MKQFTKADLNGNGTVLNETDILRGIRFDDPVEDIKHQTYFNVLDYAIKGLKQYEIFGNLFGPGIGDVDEQQKQDVLDFLKYFFPDCSITLKCVKLKETLHSATLILNWD